jgi:hypothetical protein
MTDTERERLAAILGMLGSAHDGERLAAATQAEALRRKLGVSWQNVLKPETIVVPKVIFVDIPVPSYQPYSPPLLSITGLRGAALYLFWGMGLIMTIIYVMLQLYPPRGLCRFLGIDV